MAKVYSSKEIAELRAMGAEIKLEKREVEVGGLCELVDQFKRIAKASEDLAKKNNNEMCQAIDKLTRAVVDKEVKTENLSPILNKLIELQKLAIQQPERPEYTFDIKRNSKNFMTQVVAKPVDKKVH